MSDHSVLSPSVIESIAGFTAGIVSTLTVHPLDVIKTRLQGAFPAQSAAVPLGTH